MPEWVIVGEDEMGAPVVLTGWVIGVTWMPIATVKEASIEPVVFRDRWRAKRQARRWFKDYGATCIHRERL